MPTSKSTLELDFSTSSFSFVWLSHSQSVASTNLIKLTRWQRTAGECTDQYKYTSVYTTLYSLQCGVEMKEKSPIKEKSLKMPHNLPTWIVMFNSTNKIYGLQLLKQSKCKNIPVGVAKQRHCRAIIREWFGPNHVLYFDTKYYKNTFIFSWKRT